MATRDTSADSAARFLARRGRKTRPYRRRARAEPGHPVRLAAVFPRRIAIDFAEPTLRAIHDALLDRLEAGGMDGVRLNITVIAEQMVSAALGEPSAWPGDPPLTDREVR